MKPTNRQLSKNKELSILVFFLICFSLILVRLINGRFRKSKIPSRELSDELEINALGNRCVEILLAYLRRLSTKLPTTLEESGLVLKIFEYSKEKLEAEKINTTDEDMKYIQECFQNVSNFLNLKPPMADGVLDALKNIFQDDEKSEKFAIGFMKKVENYVRARINSDD